MYEDGSSSNYTYRFSNDLSRCLLVVSSWLDQPVSYNCSLNSSTGTMELIKCSTLTIAQYRLQTYTYLIKDVSSLDEFYVSHSYKTKGCLQYQLYRF